MSSNFAIDRLVARKQSIWSEIKAHVEEAEKRGWTAEDQTKHDAMQQDYDEVKNRADELHAAAENQAKIDEQRAEYDHIVRSQPAPSNPDDVNEKKLRDWLSGEDPRKFIDIPFGNLGAVRNGNRVEVRDLSTVTAAAGGTTVPRSFQADLYQRFLDASGVRQAGARVIVNDGGAPHIVPKVASHGTASIIGEGSAMPENDPTFATIELGSWKYAEFIEVPNELIADTGVDLLDYLAKQGGYALGFGSDNHYVNGSGTNQPLGFLATAGTAVTGATAGTGVPSIANLIDMTASVDPIYQSNAGWLMRPASAAYIRKVSVASTAPEGSWAPSLAAGQPDQLLGYPLYTSPFMPAYGTPAKPIAFGAWDSFIVRDARHTPGGAVMRFERSDDYGFNRDVVAFRAVMRTDSEQVDLSGLRLFVGPST